MPSKQIWPTNGFSVPYYPKGISNDELWLTSDNTFSKMHTYIRWKLRSQT